MDRYNVSIVILGINLYVYTYIRDYVLADVSITFPAYTLLYKFPIIRRYVIEHSAL
jgi:hypothetical protein